jgi:hypothetical protein
MQVLKLHAVDGSFIDLDESNILYAGNDNEFFWEHNDEAVPEGTAVGIEIPIYEGGVFDYFSFLNFDMDDLDTIKYEFGGAYTYDSEFQEERDMAIEHFINGEFVPDSLKLVLFKNIYLKDDE